MTFTSLNYTSYENSDLSTYVLVVNLIGNGNFNVLRNIDLMLMTKSIYYLQTITIKSTVSLANDSTEYH